MEIERLAITDPILLASLFAGCALIVFFGRVEIAAGVYCATQRWAYAVDVGPTVWLWVWVFTVIASAVMFLLRRPVSQHGRSLLDREVPGLVVWLVLLMFWLFVRWVTNQNTYGTGLVKGLLLYDLLSFTAISLFGSDLSRVKAFALTFVGATLVSGIISLPPLPELSYQIQTSTFLLVGPDAVNYLAFAVPFAIASVFLLVFIGQTALWWYRSLAICAMIFCVFCLLLTGARQSIIATVVAWVVFISWALRQEQRSRRIVIVALAMVLLVGIVVYSQTTLISRWTAPEARLSDLGGRMPIWQDAWGIFLHSPIWGAGFDYFGESYTAHDLWLDALAGHGIVGFILLNGFLLATLRCTRGTWSASGSDELSAWRAGAFCALIYALIQAIPAGAIGASTSHIFWISALVWQLNVAVQRKDPADATASKLRVPLRRLA